MMSTTGYSVDLRTKKPKVACQRCARKEAQAKLLSQVGKKNAAKDKAERVQQTSDLVYLIPFYRSLRQEEKWKEFRKKVDDDEANNLLKWINNNLTSSCRITNLYIDLSDGLKIVYLLEVLYKCHLNKENPLTRLHKMKNFQSCIDFMELSRQVKCIGISSTELVEGNHKILLGFLFLIRHDYEYTFCGKSFTISNQHIRATKSVPLIIPNAHTKHTNKIQKIVQNERMDRIEHVDSMSEQSLKSKSKSSVFSYDLDDSKSVEHARKNDSYPLINGSYDSLESDGKSSNIKSDLSSKSLSDLDSIPNSSQTDSLVDLMRKIQKASANLINVSENSLEKQSTSVESFDKISLSDEHTKLEETIKDNNNIEDTEIIEHEGSTGSTGHKENFIESSVTETNGHNMSPKMWQNNPQDFFIIIHDKQISNSSEQIVPDLDDVITDDDQVLPINKVIMQNKITHPVNGTESFENEETSMNGSHGNDGNYLNTSLCKESPDFKDSYNDQQFECMKKSQSAEYLFQNTNQNEEIINSQKVGSNNDFKSELNGHSSIFEKNTDSSNTQSDVDQVKKANGISHSSCENFSDSDKEDINQELEENSEMKDSEVFGDNNLSDEKIIDTIEPVLTINSTTRQQIEPKSDENKNLSIEIPSISSDKHDITTCLNGSDTNSLSENLSEMSEDKDTDLIDENFVYIEQNDNLDSKKIEENVVSDKLNQILTQVGQNNEEPSIDKFCDEPEISKSEIDSLHNEVSVHVYQISAQNTIEQIQINEGIGENMPKDNCHTINLATSDDCVNILVENPTEIADEFSMEENIQSKNTDQKINECNLNHHSLNGGFEINEPNFENDQINDLLIGETNQISDNKDKELLMSTNSIEEYDKNLDSEQLQNLVKEKIYDMTDNSKINQLNGHVSEHSDNEIPSFTKNKIQVFEKDQISNENSQINQNNSITVVSLDNNLFGNSVCTKETYSSIVQQQNSAIKPSEKIINRNEKMEEKNTKKKTESNSVSQSLLSKAPRNSNHLSQTKSHKPASDVKKKSPKIFSKDQNLETNRLVETENKFRELEVIDSLSNFENDSNLALSSNGMVKRTNSKNKKIKKKPKVDSIIYSQSDDTKLFRTLNLYKILIISMVFIIISVFILLEF